MNNGMYEVTRQIINPNLMPELDEVWEMEKLYEMLYLEIPNDDVAAEADEEEPF